MNKYPCHERVYIYTCLVNSPRLQAPKKTNQNKAHLPYNVVTKGQLATEDLHLRELITFETHPIHHLHYQKEESHAH